MVGMVGKLKEGSGDRGMREAGERVSMVAAKVRDAQRPRRGGAEAAAAEGGERQGGGACAAVVDGVDRVTPGRGEGGDGGGRVVETGVALVRGEGGRVSPRAGRGGMPALSQSEGVQLDNGRRSSWHHLSLSDIVTALAWRERRVADTLSRAAWGTSGKGTVCG